MKIIRWGMIICILLITLPLIGKGEREVQQPPLPMRESLSSEKTFSIGLLKSDNQLFLNPLQATEATSLLVLDGLFEGLFNLNPVDGKPIPALAQMVSLSDDELIWTITIKEQAYFSNGEEITADTFVSSWVWLLEQARNNEGNTYLLSMLDAIEGVQEFRKGMKSSSELGITAEGKYTIRITLTTPAPYLPNLFSMLPFSAIHPSFRNSKNQPLPTDMITSGPFRITHYSETHVLLEKHPWYVDYDNVPSDYIEFVFGQAEDIRAAYEQRAIHWALSYIPRELLHNPEDLRISPEYSTGFFYFSAKSGAYANPNVRKALSLLIPWDAIRLQSGQLFPTSHLIPDHSSPMTPQTFNQEEQLQQALSLLSESGFPYGAGLPPLHMAIHRGSQVEASAGRIADIWSQTLGITVVTDTLPLGMYARFPESTPYDFAFITWIGDFQNPLTFFHLWNSDSGYNLGNMHDKTYDALLAEAMSVPQDSQKGKTLLQQAEQYLLSNAAVFPLYHGITIHVILSDTVVGWYDNILDFHPIKYLGIQ